MTFLEQIHREKAECWLLGAGGRGSGSGELAFNQDRVSFLQGEGHLEMGGDDGVNVLGATELCI